MEPPIEETDLVENGAAASDEAGDDGDDDAKDSGDGEDRLVAEYF